MAKNKILSGLAIGTGIAAIAAAAAGTYFLYGSKNAPKNRKKVKAWMLNAKGEILERIENLSEINEETYHKIVKEVTDKYQSLKKIEKKEMDEFVKEVKSLWKSIARDIKDHVIKNKK